jgi:hypothetical protein
MSTRWQAPMFKRARTGGRPISIALPANSGTEPGDRRTADTPRDFDEFARGRQLGGATIVLFRRRFGQRLDRARTALAQSRGADQRPDQYRTGHSTGIAPMAYCESMCVFLLLSGKTRYVPETAHVRVHQIWIGDRAAGAKARTYSADDLMIVERDIGRLAKYTFDMGGAGDLLSLSLNVPPWEDLHELSREELRLTNLVTTDMDAEPGSPNAAVVELTNDQDCFGSML